MVSHDSVASSKPKVELDSHADMCVVADNCLVIHDHNKLVYVYSYDPKHGHRIIKRVNAAKGYQDQQSRQKCISIINQAICINGLKTTLLCPMQCHLNGVHVSEVPKFLAESTSVTTYALELIYSLNAASMLIIPHQLSRVTTYLDLYTLNLTGYANENIPNIYLTAE